MKIVADSAIPFLQGVLEPWAEVRYLPGSRIAAEDVRDADALIIRTRTRRVTCAVLISYKQGGLSCDWEHATKTAEKTE